MCDKRRLADIALHGHDNPSEVVTKNLFEGNAVDKMYVDDEKLENGPYNTFFRNLVHRKWRVETARIKGDNKAERRAQQYSQIVIGCNMSRQDENKITDNGFTKYWRDGFLGTSKEWRDLPNECKSFCKTGT